MAEEETHFDGYSCAWWADKQAFLDCMESPEWQAVVDDGDNVFDMQWLWNMSAQLEEVVQVDGPVAPYKVVWVMKFLEGMDKAAADEHWTNVHGPIFHGLPIERYVQNHVVGPVGADGDSDAEIGFDGFSECWFNDEAQFLEAVAVGGLGGRGRGCPERLRRVGALGRGAARERGRGGRARQLIPWRCGACRGSARTVVHNVSVVGCCPRVQHYVVEGPASALSRAWRWLRGGRRAGAGQAGLRDETADLA